MTLNGGIQVYQQQSDRHVELHENKSLTYCTVRADL